MKRILTNIEALEVLPRDLGDQNPPDLIFAANEARFTVANYSAPLTSYLIGWPDEEDLEALLETICPAVETARRFEYKSAVNAEAFLSETDDMRSIGSSFKLVEYKGTSVNDKTLNKGLGIRIDHDDALGDAWQEQAVVRLRNRLLRNEIRRALALIDAAATAAMSVWNATTQPDADLRTLFNTSVEAVGVSPSRLLISAAAWNLRKAAYEAQNTAGGFARCAMTPEALAADLMLDKVQIVKPVYQSAVATKSRVMTALTCLMYNAQSGISKDDPSNVKRFVTPAGAGRWRVFVTPHEKFTDIMVEQYSNISITGTTGIEKLTVRAAN